MTKQAKTIFLCGECGYESGKWLGKCPACGSWNTLVEERVLPLAPANHAGLISGLAAHAMPLEDIITASAARLSTGENELDRVLGGGVVPGSAILLGGDPGIGKSTLLMQAANGLAANGAVLYVTGEESAPQLKLRAERLGVHGGMLLLAETDLNAILAEAERIKPAFLIVDSIQTMICTQLPGAPGSVSQVREATALLTRLAKTTGCAVFIVGHVTKEGAIAGPRILEHMVDTVLYFEGDQHDAYRLLRAVKNRFGSTDEIGVFEMRSEGMIGVDDPSSLFLTGTNAPGCAVTCAMEGSRPLLAEVQALLSPSAFHNPRRMAAGMDGNRLILLLAVLEKKAGLRLSEQDAYTNVVGGLRLEERSADLAIALCVASALTDIPLPPRTALLGELSLTGEVRAVSRLDKRVQECARLGFSHIVVPQGAAASLPPLPGVRYTQVAHIHDAMRLLTK
ncbi:MAG: DNA repair protein RadA [Christensenellaceae bacterium]|jgi:DNA repair protein RadA/Sms|nr:DNA repair protein RadA [Christensenellaceae bacterium]